jgi:hypothetical protein
MLNLGAADKQQVINNDGCGEMRPRVGPNQCMAWPLYGASGSGPRAEQRQSKLVGEVGAIRISLVLEPENRPRRRRRRRRRNYPPAVARAV